jgi:hypothetical protein
MMMTRNYYSKVEHCRRYGLPDVRMMITKIIIVKLSTEDNIALCEYRRMFA